MRDEETGEELQHVLVHSCTEDARPNYASAKIFTVDSRRLFLERTECCSFFLDSFSSGRSHIRVLGLGIFDDFG